MSSWKRTWNEPWMEEVYLKIRNGNLAEVSSMNVFIIDTDSCVPWSVYRSRNVLLKEMLIYQWSIHMVDIFISPPHCCM